MTIKIHCPECDTTDITWITRIGADITLYQCIGCKRVFTERESVNNLTLWEITDTPKQEKTTWRTIFGR